MSGPIFLVGDGKDFALATGGVGQPYRHCRLDLAGFGVRDLCVQGDRSVSPVPSRCRVWRKMRSWDRRERRLACAGRLAIQEPRTRSAAQSYR